MTMTQGMTALHLASVEAAEEREMLEQLAADRRAAEQVRAAEQQRDATAAASVAERKRRELGKQLGHLDPLHAARAVEVAAELDAYGLKAGGWRSARTVDDLPATFQTMNPPPAPALVFEQANVGGFMLYPDTAHPSVPTKIFNEADVLHPELSRTEKLEFLKARSFDQARELVKSDKNNASATMADRLRIRSQIVTRATISSAGLDPVISGYVFSNSLFRIIGPPGSLKSFVALDMAAAVAEGKWWQGNPVKQGNVVYIAAEGSDGIGKRMAAWEVVNERPFPENVYVLPMPLQVTSAGWSALLAECVEFIKPVMIIGDTQARLTLGVNENGSTEMGAVVARLDEMRQATGAAVGLVHHSTKDGLGGGRGSSAVEGAMQSEIRVTKTGKSGEEIATVSSTRQKDDGRRDDLELKTRVVGLQGELGEDIHGRPITSLAFELLDLFGTPKAPAWPREVLKATIVEIVRGVSHLGATKAEIRAMLKDRPGDPPHSMQYARALDELASSGEIVTVQGSSARFTVPANTDQNGETIPAFVVPTAPTP